MADVVRAKYKGKDTGDGMPWYHGVPSRDLTDADFDTLDEDQKELVRRGDLYDYVPYTEKARSIPRIVRAEPTQQPETPNTEGDK